MGVTEPEATFSSCFGGAFLMWHPMEYANRLADKMEEHNATAWFVNTGWTGGQYGVGNRMSLKHTRAIIDAIHNGELHDAEYVRMPVFGLDVPKHVTGVPDSVLQPWSTWSDARAYEQAVRNLATLFRENMKQYSGSSLVSPRLSKEIDNGGPDPLEQVLRTKGSGTLEHPVLCSITAGTASIDKEQLKPRKLLA
jgi:phosphoenolpyruvate carboxykinase (ATP)